MIRLYRDIVRLALLGLYYLKTKDVNLKTLIEVAENVPLTEDHNLRSALLVANDHLSTNSPENSVTTNVSLLARLLNAKAAPSHEGDLIDQVVDSLQLPYTGSIIAGSRLRNLRNAILLPEELSSFKSGAAKKELSCGICGLPVANGEMVTIYGNTDDVRVACLRCHFPSKLPCHKPKCEANVMLPSALETHISKILQKADCGGHTKEDKDVTVAAAPDPMNPNLGQRLADAAGIFGRTRTVRATAPTPTLQPVTWTIPPGLLDDDGGF